MIFVLKNMKVLLINKFLYPKGGDAISTLTTGELLSKKGHSVVFWGMKHPANPEYPYAEYFVDYIDYEGALSVKKKISYAITILYSFEAREMIRKLLKKDRPDIVHLNNFAHQISPSILNVFSKYNLPVVMTMRDYKLVCPSYSMLLDGKPCEMCKNGKYYWCFFNKCTKNSFSKSLLNTLEMYLHHRIMHIYKKIDVFISPSIFLMNKIREMNFTGKVIYLPNFVNLELFSPCYDSEDNSIVYTGRLSPEKGIMTLMRAVKGLNVKLKIIGEGPLREELEGKKLDNVYFFGYMDQKELKEELKKSILLVIPSKWYENNPRVVMEAFATGKPVIGARIGGIPELVKDGVTGYTFKPGNAWDLRSKILMLTRDPDKIVQMGKNARKFVEENFNQEKHYQGLMEIYQMALGKHKK